MKLQLLVAATVLLPSIARSGDLSGTNVVTGFTASASGFQNSVSGAGSVAFGTQNYVNGINNLAAGLQNLVDGNYCAVTGLYNNSAPNSNFNTICGFANKTTGSLSILAGAYLADGGFNGSVMLSDSNTLGKRSPAARFTSPGRDTFSAIFNGGYYARTNDGQPGAPDAGLFIKPSVANTTTTSYQAYVGINTTTPAVPLDVNGSVLLDLGAITYFTQGAATTALSNLVGGGILTSIRASARVQATGFMAYSDERIKSVQGQSNSAEDLGKLLAIEVTDFIYKDVVEKGNLPQKKVIAQQVEKVFPQAVSRSTNVVPDIYKTAPIQNGWVDLTTNLEVGDRVRLITQQGQRADHVVLEIKNGKFRTDFSGDSGQVFVYGREVKDFRSVDYEAIAMLNVSATQELARKVAARDAEIAQLTAKLAALEVRDQNREARLARLESAGSTGKAQPVSTSINRNTSN